jgi:hypothetical protein
MEKDRLKSRNAILWCCVTIYGEVWNFLHLEKAMGVYRYAYQQVGAVCQRAVVVIVLRLIVEKVVKCCSHSDALSNFLYSRQFPQRISRIADLIHSF